MEKVLQRTLLNRNQLVKKDRRKLEQAVRKTWRDYNRTRNAQAAQLQDYIKQERKSRREDWTLGPLAPKRDAGIHTHTYGAVSYNLMQSPELPRRESRWPRGDGYDAEGSEDKRMPGFEDGEWRGEGLIGNLALGDRVVIIHGRSGVKGKIGEVTKIDEKANTVNVKGINKVDMIVAPQSRPNAQDTEIFDHELPLNIADIRLVHTMVDEETGHAEDVIIRHIYGGYPWIQRKVGSNLPRHTRYIKNFTSPPTTNNPTPKTEDVELPWPKEDPDRFYNQPSDTTRGEVEKVTYIPSIAEQLPMPEGVIDELRNKHARTRRDWDDREWLKRKMLEDARRDWFEERSKILSQPFWSKEYLRKEKREMDAKIPSKETEVDL